MDATSLLTNTELAQTSVRDFIVRAPNELEEVIGTDLIGGAEEQAVVARRV